MSRRLLLALAALACFSLALASTASAEFGLQEVDVDFKNGVDPAVQAGSHPETMSTRVAFNVKELPGELELPDEQLKNLVAELPVGFVGNPLATAKCSGADFANISKETNLPACANDAVVGVVNVSARLDERPPDDPSLGSYVPVYNLQPGPGQVAKFGFAYLQVPITIEAQLSERSPFEKTPYKIIASVTNASQVVQLFATELILWGDPSSPSHDPFRGTCLDIEQSVGELVSQGNCPMTLEDPPAFLTMPRSCTGEPLESNFTVSSWEHPETLVSKDVFTFEEAEPFGITGCDELEFSPEVSLAPTGTQADSPSGIAFDLEIDDPGLVSNAPEARAQSDIKKVVATLPEGVALNPSLAGGLEACSSTQIAQETADSLFGAGCPSASKIGSVEVETPLLDQELTGSVFVAKQQDNPFGSLGALYVVIKNAELGVSVSLAGRVDLDPKTGQIVSTFEELPQIPFSHFELRFREGPRAPLIAPSACGTYETKVVLTPWANPQEPVTETSSFEITAGAGGGPCPSGALPFGPSFEAGTLNPVAGAYSPFVLRLQRNDGTQRLAGLELDLPQGLVGKLAGIPYCPDDVLASIAAQDQLGQGAGQLANPSCPAASQIGKATVGAGAGSQPVYIDTGRVYLAGPYKGAPLSVAVVNPAVTGPFDLGNVVVRAALYVDPETAKIHTVSDPLPTILHGIPLDVRDVQLALDRPDFTLNPTSCEEKAFTGNATSEAGASAPLNQRFQASSCSSLGFKPQLKISMLGKTKRTGHPALKAVLRPKPGQANIGRTVVVLPRSQFIDNAHIGNPCTRPQFAANSCPAVSVLGKAKAFSPLLDQPLQGRVYFRSNGGDRELPDIVVDLDGQIHVTLVGFVDSVQKKGSEKSRLRTTFATVPDAPVSKFELSLFGGKRGLLVNSENLCAKPRYATVKMDGQNGKTHDSEVEIKTSCPKKGKGKGGGKGGKGRG